ncbi:hypothetical protein BH20VER1_BH20VER1_05290 [soil metagenome]
MRSVVHAVAEPIVHHAPRAVLRAATAPVRAGYRAVARSVEEFDEEICEAPAAEPPQVRRAERLQGRQAMHVAYMASRPQRPAPDTADLRDEDEPQNEPPQVEHRGSRPMVQGSRAVLRNGLAYAPSRAPESVKAAIWAGNELRRKPYIWGGGHGSFYDCGYDCSGTVSYALHAAGASRRHCHRAG